MITRILVALLPVAAAACVSVRPVLAPAQFIPTKQPEVVWVTQQSGEVIPVARPTLRGDTLVGNWLGTAEPVAVHLPRMSTMLARQPDPKRTRLLVVGTVALGGLFVWQVTRLTRGGCRYDPGGTGVHACL
jgi:hypothetical protein